MEEQDTVSNTIYQMNLGAQTLPLSSSSLTALSSSAALVSDQNKTLLQLITDLIDKSVNTSETIQNKLDAINVPDDSSQIKKEVKFNENKDNIFNCTSQGNLLDKYTEILNSQGIQFSPEDTNSKKMAIIASILGMIDTIHDFWKGGRGSSQSNENMTIIHKSLIELYKKLYTCDSIDSMDDILNKCMKCEIGDNQVTNMSSNQIEPSGKGFIESITSLGKNTIGELSYTEFANGNNKITINQKEIDINDCDILLLKNSDGNFSNLIQNEEQRNLLSNKILNFFGRDMIYYTYDSYQSPFGKIFTNNYNAKRILTPQNIADSATAQAIDITDESLIYYFPKNTDVESFKTNSNYFTNKAYDIHYKNNPDVPFGVGTDPLYNFTYNIKSKVPIPDGYTQLGENGIEFKYDEKANTGPSVNYLIDAFTSIKKPMDTSQSTSTNVKVSKGKATKKGGRYTLKKYNKNILINNKIIGGAFTDDKKGSATSIRELVNKINTLNSSFLIFDLKRGGDYDQISAMKHFNEKNNEEGIVVTGDTLCSVKSRLENINTIFKSQDNLYLYKMGQSLKPSELTVKRLKTTIPLLGKIFLQDEENNFSLTNNIYFFIDLIKNEAIDNSTGKPYNLWVDGNNLFDDKNSPIKLSQKQKEDNNKFIEIIQKTFELKKLDITKYLENFIINIVNIKTKTNKLISPILDKDISTIDNKNEEEKKINLKYITILDTIFEYLQDKNYDRYFINNIIHIPIIKPKEFYESQFKNPTEPQIEYMDPDSGSKLIISRKAGKIEVKDLYDKSGTLAVRSYGSMNSNTKFTIGSDKFIKFKTKRLTYQGRYRFINYDYNDYYRLIRCIFDSAKSLGKIFNNFEKYKDSFETNQPIQIDKDLLNSNNSPFHIPIFISLYNRMLTNIINSYQTHNDSDINNNKDTLKSLLISIDNYNKDILNEEESTHNIINNENESSSDVAQSSSAVASSSSSAEVSTKPVKGDILIREILKFKDTFIVKQYIDIYNTLLKYIGITNVIEISAKKISIKNVIQEKMIQLIKNILDSICQIADNTYATKTKKTDKYLLEHNGIGNQQFVDYCSMLVHLISIIIKTDKFNDIHTSLNIISTEYDQCISSGRIPEIDSLNKINLDTTKSDISNYIILINLLKSFILLYINKTSGVGINNILTLSIGDNSKLKEYNKSTAKEIQTDLINTQFGEIQLELEKLQILEKIDKYPSSDNLISSKIKDKDADDWIKTHLFTDLQGQEATNKLTELIEKYEEIKLLLKNKIKIEKVDPLKTNITLKTYQLYQDDIKLIYSLFINEWIRIKEISPLLSPSSSSSPLSSSSPPISSGGNYQKGGENVPYIYDEIDSELYESYYDNRMTDYYTDLFFILCDKASSIVDNILKKNTFVNNNQLLEVIRNKLNKLNTLYLEINDKPLDSTKKYIKLEKEYIINQITYLNTKKIDLSNFSDKEIDIKQDPDKIIQIISEIDIILEKGKESILYQIELIKYKQNLLENIYNNKNNEELYNMIIDNFVTVYDESAEIINTDELQSNQSPATKKRKTTSPILGGVVVNGMNEEQQTDVNAGISPVPAVAAPTPTRVSMNVPSDGVEMPVTDGVEISAPSDAVADAVELSVSDIIDIPVIDDDNEEDEEEEQKLNINKLQDQILLSNKGDIILSFALINDIIHKKIKRGVSLLSVYFPNVNCINSCLEDMIYLTNTNIESICDIIQNTSKYFNMNDTKSELLIKVKEIERKSEIKIKPSEAQQKSEVEEKKQQQQLSVRSPSMGFTRSPSRVLTRTPSKVLREATQARLQREKVIKQQDQQVEQELPVLQPAPKSKSSQIVTFKSLSSSNSSEVGKKRKQFPTEQSREQQIYATTGRGGRIKTRSHKPKSKQQTRKGGLKEKMKQPEKLKKKSFSRTLYKVDRFLKKKTRSKK
jgi:hypothetical protein